MPRILDGRTVIVIGGISGIGAAARILRQQHANVVVTILRRPLRASPRHWAGRRGWITPALTSQTLGGGRLGVLVSNAGTSFRPDSPLGSPGLRPQCPVPVQEAAFTTAFLPMSIPASLALPCRSGESAI
jgi:NAD(P)-dependent dehydrogenase (short-subunit alcohol dehydrogenase family)